MNKKLSNKITIDYIFIYIFFHALTACVFGFGVYTLTQRGFSSSIAGTSLGLANLIGVMLSPLLSNISELNKKYNLFIVTFFTALFVFLTAIANYLLTNTSILLFIIFTLNAGLYITCEPLLNALSSMFINTNVNINFASIRAFGSLSYAIFCYIFGKVSIIFGYQSVLLISFICALLLTIMLVIINNDYKKVTIINKEKQERENVSFKEFIANNKLFMVGVIFLSFIWFGYTSFDNFMLLIVENVGGNSNDLGSVLSFKAICETVAIFFIYPMLKKYFNIKKVLYIGALGFIGKTLFQTIAPNIIALHLSQIWQGFSFALILPGMVDFINQYLPDNQVIRGQALSSTSSCLGSVFASVIAGYIADMFSINIMQYCALLFCIIGAVGFIITISKLQKSH